MYVHSTYLLPETSLAFQHGKENSAHKEGMKIMIDEIEYLSKEDLDKGHIMVSWVSLKEEQIKMRLLAQRMPFCSVHNGESIILQQM